jgi:hypothetical protein
MRLMWKKPFAASLHELGTPPTTTMRKPSLAIASSTPMYSKVMTRLRQQ